MSSQQISRWLVAVLVVCGCAESEAPIVLPTGPIVISDADAKPKFPDEATAEFYKRWTSAPESDFRQFAPLAEGVRTCTNVTLYEGLPNDFDEETLLISERRTKDTIQIDGCDFYKRPLVLSEESSRELTAIFCTPKLFSPYFAPKSCGGFHADYCVDGATMPTPTKPSSVLVAVK